MSIQAQQNIAYHEAGHTLLNYYCGWEVSSFGYLDSTKKAGVTNSDKSKDLDYTWVKNLPNFYSISVEKKQLVISKSEDRILLAVAGEISERKFDGRELITLQQFPHYWTEDEHSDIHTVKIIKEKLLNELGYRIHGNNLLIKCKSVINSNWSFIQELANSLINCENILIEKSEIEKILFKHSFDSHP